MLERIIHLRDYLQWSKSTFGALKVFKHAKYNINVILKAFNLMYRYIFSMIEALQFNIHKLFNKIDGLQFNFYIVFSMFEDLQCPKSTF